jgi:predicted RNase H-like HicB family nuclease
MNEIVLTAEHDEEGGWLVAAWNDPAGGGITTQARDLRELEANVREAVRCHFGDGPMPRTIRLHFLNDPVLTPA